MRRVFVTGATGFIGSYLVRQLLGRNIEVAVLVRPESDLWRIADIQDQLTIFIWNGLSVDSFSGTFREFAPDTVFQLGWAGVGNTHRNDVLQQFDNVRFAVELAQLSADCGVQCWIGAGSQAEYGPCDRPISESMLPQPTTLYGAAKLSAMLMTERIAALHEMRHVWVRIFSTYGPLDNDGWMIPGLISKLFKRERPALTAGEQLWDYLHVDDAARAFLQLAESKACGVFNLGSGEALPLRKIIETIRDFIDPTLPLGFGEVPYRPDQVMRLQADITRIESTTEWRPLIPLIIGLQALVESNLQTHGSSGNS